MYDLLVCKNDGVVRAGHGLDGSVALLLAWAAVDRRAYRAVRSPPSVRAVAMRAAGGVGSIFVLVVQSASVLARGLPNADRVGARLGWIALSIRIGRQRERHRRRVEPQDGSLGAHLLSRVHVSSGHRPHGRLPGKARRGRSTKAACWRDRQRRHASTPALRCVRRLVPWLASPETLSSGSMRETLSRGGDEEADERPGKSGESKIYRGKRAIAARHLALLKERERKRQGSDNYSLQRCYLLLYML